MKKIAFVYPGQGSQYPGMGKDIYNEFSEAREVFESSNAILKENLTNTIFQGTEEDLLRTEITQPAIVTMSHGITKILTERGITPNAVAGLSLGEYSSLIAAKSISFEDCINLVRKRGLYMEEAVPRGKGSMAAVIGMKEEEIKTIIDSYSEKGTINIANYNCPGQIVISGETELVLDAMDKLKEIGAKKIIKLNVAGPFHTNMLFSASEKLRNELNKIDIVDTKTDMYFNVLGEKINNSEEIKESLENQVCNSVLWEKTIDNMILRDEIEIFLEIGPGKTLSSFIKKINKKHKKEIEIYNLNSAESINDFLNS